jgi:predicted lipase
MEKQQRPQTHQLARCCRLSIYTYKNRQYKNIVTLDGLSNKKHKHDAQAMIIPHKEALYVAFRGSSTINDFKDVVNVVPKKTQYGLVHSGFHNQFISLQDMLEQHIINHNKKDVYFFGHSMGGSVALISSVFFKEKYPSMDVRCFTYGSPPTACANFLGHAEKTLNDFVSIEISHDIVPWIPLGPFYVKNKQHILLSRDMDLHPLDVYANHSCVTYYKMLKQQYFSDVSKNDIA